MKQEPNLAEAWAGLARVDSIMTRNGLILPWSEGVNQNPLTWLVTVAADLSSLSKTRFWTFLDNRAWCHLYDADGRRRDFDDIPTSIAKLADDPYRSLAGELRRAGGYAKDTTPFSEFLWADALRSQVRRKQIEHRFADALAKALKFAKSQAASYLPGWCGPQAD